MTKKLDPDLKAIRAINRALNDLPDDRARKRVLEWVIAFNLNVSGWALPDVRVWRKRPAVAKLEQAKGHE